MKIDIKKIVRVLLLFCFTSIVFFSPILLAYIGTRHSGINLRNSLAEGSTIVPLAQLIVGSESAAADFRSGLLRGFLYSTIVAITALVFALFYLNWTAGWTKKKAIGISFALLCFTLLPQTYLIMPALLLFQNLPHYPAEYLKIMIFLFIGVLPLSAWILYLMAGNRTHVLQERCALDQLSIFRSFKILLGEVKIDILLVFLVTWAIVWSNYLIPYALGSSKSFTAVVLISTFTSNLGRDWAMICAAGFIVSLPGIIVGVTLGLRVMGGNK